MALTNDFLSHCVRLHDEHVALAVLSRQVVLISIKTLLCLGARHKEVQM